MYSFTFDITDSDGEVIDGYQFNIQPPSKRAARIVREALESAERIENVKVTTTEVTEVELD